MEESLRLYTEMERHLLLDARPSRYLHAVAHDPALEQYPFRLLKAMQTTNQSPQHHPEGSVWNHTLLVVDEAAQRKQASTNPRVFMWAALLHDIGKPVTTKTRKGRVTAYGHDTAGAALAEEFLLALRAQRPFVAQVSGLVRYHMHILYVCKGLPYADLPGMLARVPLRDVALLGLCDRLGRTGADRQAEEKQIEQFIKQCEQVRKGGANGTKPAGKPAHERHEQHSHTP